MVRTDLIRTISDTLTRQAEQQGGAPAVSDSRETVTYAQLQDHTRRIAGHVAGSTRPGDRVAVLMPSSVACAEAMLATVRAGAISVPIPASATPDEVAFVLGDSGARALFVDAARVDDARALRQPGLRLIVTGKPGGDASFEEWRSREAGGPASEPETLHDPAWILYTSGTTGRPKGVVLTRHSLLWVAAAGIVPVLGWERRDVALSPLPLWHSYPLEMLLATLAVGGHLRILERFSLDGFLRVVAEVRPTVLMGVPTIYAYVLNALEGDGHDAQGFERVRLCLTGGAPLPPDLADRFRARTGIQLADAYGATEASSAVTLTSWRGPFVPGSCGVSLPGMAVRVVDPQTGADRRPGAEGEIICRGPGIMREYHDRPDETAQALREGWYHTGDLGVLDDAGYLRVTGRIKELIIRGGENIAPAEIEAAFVRQTGLVDCAVVGVEDAALGEVPAFAFVAADGVVIADLVASLEERAEVALPPFKRPVRYAAVDAIPRTPSGKVRRHELRDLVGGAVA